MKCIISFKTLFLSLFVLCCSTNLFAQTAILKGRVIDEKGNPIANATVANADGNEKVETQENGIFSLKIPINVSNLNIAHVGFVSKVIQIQNLNDSVIVKLAEVVSPLDEVIVVGYGTAKKKDVTGSIVNLTSKDFNKGGVITNPIQQVAGKVAGLVVTQPSGDPNQNVNIRLRGQTSLTGNQSPLIVVDGVQLPDPNMISTIAPGDIVSYDVLKDASATAIYGARGANGVILIGTKHGASGKAQVDYAGSVTMDHRAKKYDLLNASEYLAAGGKTNNAAAPPYNYTLSNGNTDWMDAITRTGVTTNQNIGISGGSPTFNYHGSFNYINQQGIIINSGKEMYGINFNAQQKSFDNKLVITMGINSNRVNRKYVDPSIFYYVLEMPPVAPIYDSSGGYYGFFNSFDVNNPVPKQKMQINKGTDQTMLINGSIDYELIKGLKLGVTGAMSFYNLQVDYFQPVLPGYGNINKAGKYTENNNSKRGDIHANYLKELGKHSINATAVYEYNKFTYDNYAAVGQNYIYEGYENNNLGGGNPERNIINSTKNGYLLISFLGRIMYNYDSRYYLTASLRRDGSDKFGSAHQWGYFPSISASWRINREKFMEGVTWINDLRLGAGFGRTGNADGLAPYQTLSLYGPSGIYYSPSTPAYSYPTSYTASQNPNKDLRWETRQGVNVQLEFGLFKNRLSGSVNVFSDKTKDMIYNYTVPTPPFFVNNIWANVGDLTNKGWEIQLNGDVIRSNDFKWNLGGQISFVKTRVANLSGTYNGYELNTDQIIAGSAAGRGLSNAYLTYLKVGYSPYVFFLPHYVGLDADGKELFDNGNGGTVGSAGLNNDMKRYINPAPKFTYGINNSFSYKNWDLNFFLRGVSGQKVYNGVRMLIDNVGGLNNGNMTRSGLASGDKDDKILSDKWLENASFLRLDNATISYSFKKLSSKVDNLRVYFTGNNLFVITKYRGLDPEVQITSSSYLDGSTGAKTTLNNAYIDQVYTGNNSDNAYYKSRSFTLGVNLSFK
ncbi:SusC/RagA family TonB-linked outer membrane protein [Rhizosphaericola mali]|uniref:SusC/RagA family TonB-linked outer membrane protein n=1 Tax=Rhizosphaericola mali TaxID=2545455 RepID=A0A5P2G701_9BACT|nr:SusC/RagA family TonB-linked outer membrane protein [Rhizosphaericola mali]QES87291.1 SusC/RagA family TonB-linked outer membrane protein [Rhizosphaericola mali]